MTLPGKMAEPTLATSKAMKDIVLKIRANLWIILLLSLSSGRKGKQREKSTSFRRANKSGTASEMLLTCAEMTTTKLAGNSKPLSQQSRSSTTC